ncbi:MAG: serine hydrolase domain-containing protein [Solirubrobacteraceae bacterium]
MAEQRSVSGETINGLVESGFEPVREAFAENFSKRGEVGAAFAAVLDGRPVVDLWGGVADRGSGRPWQQDTMQLIFSGTKGLTTLCIAMLIDRGKLRLEDPVCLHWPEFAANGKDSVTVAHVLSHRARLPAVRTPISIEDVLDPQRIEALVAAQPQESDPRAEFIYHARTLGWICDGLIRRVDGRSTGQFFAQEVAAPLGLDLWIGLPSELEERVAVLHYGPAWGKSVFGRPESDPFPGDELWARIWANPVLYPAGDIPWNEPALHAAEIPSSNGIGTASSIARMYGTLARGGEIDGVRLLSAETIARLSTPAVSGHDPFTGAATAFSHGFEVQSTDMPFGPEPSAYGFTGTGASTHGAWPERRVGFSYAMNELRDDLDGDERPRALLEALHGCLPAFG